MTQLSKEEKRKKSKERREAKKIMAKKETQKELETSKEDAKKKILFVNKKGAEVSIGQFLTDDDFWSYQVKRGEKKKIKYVISYEGIKKLAREAGISSVNFEVLVEPSLQNRMTTYVKCTLGCDDCQHDIGETNKIGEASDENTSNLSKRYKGMIAEKRAYVRAVIDHLQLPDIYGEDEFSEEPGEDESKEVGLKRSEFEALAPLMNQVINAQNEDELASVGEAIKQEMVSLSSAQIDHLRKLYSERLKALKPANF